MKKTLKELIALEYQYFMKKRPCTMCQYYLPTREKQCSLFLRNTHDDRYVAQYAGIARQNHEMCGISGRYYLTKNIPSTHTK